MTLLLLADSLAFHGPERAEAPDHPALFGNVCARALQPRPAVDLVARMGWTARDGWWAATKDPVVWGTYLPRAAGLVISLGHFDQLPAAVPTWLRETLPYVRPGRVRRPVRRAYLAAAPHVIRATGGRMSQLPPVATSHYLGRLVTAVRHLRPGLPIVRLLPSPWHSRIYPVGRPHPGAVAAARAWCREYDVAAVDLDSAVDVTTNNPDGLHWGWDTHARVGERTAAALVTAGWAA